MGIFYSSPNLYSGEHNIFILSIISIFINIPTKFNKIQTLIKHREDGELTKKKKDCLKFGHLAQSFEIFSAFKNRRKQSFNQDLYGDPKEQVYEKERKKMLWSFCIISRPGMQPSSNKSGIENQQDQYNQEKQEHFKTFR